MSIIINSYRFTANGTYVVCDDHSIAELVNSLRKFNAVMLSINENESFGVMFQLDIISSKYLDAVRTVGSRYIANIDGGNIIADSSGELLAKMIVTIRERRTVPTEQRKLSVERHRPVVEFYSKSGDHIHLSNATPEELLSILVLIDDVNMRVDGNLSNVSNQLRSIQEKLEGGKITFSARELIDCSATNHEGGIYIDPYLALHEFIERETIGSGIVSHISFEVFKRDTFLTVSVIDVENFDKEKDAISNKLTDTYIMLANLYLEFPSDSNPFDNLNQKTNLLCDIFNTITERQIKGVLMVDSYNYYDYEIKVTVKR